MMKMLAITIMILTCSVSWARGPSLHRKAKLLSRELKRVEDSLSRREKRLIRRHMRKIANILDVRFGDTRTSPALYCMRTGDSRYKLTKVERGTDIVLDSLRRRGTSLESCTRRRKKVLEGLYCKHTGRNRYKVAELRTGAAVDSRRGKSLDVCFARMRLRVRYPDSQ